MSAVYQLCSRARITAEGVACRHMHICDSLLLLSGKPPRSFNGTLHCCSLFLVLLSLASAACISVPRVRWVQR